MLIKKAEKYYGQTLQTSSQFANIAMQAVKFNHLKRYPHAHKNLSGRWGRTHAPHQL